MSNSRETTIYDIAEVLKISPATVSRGLKDHPAISQKTKMNILAMAKQMGYRTNTLARNFRQQKSNIIGVIVPRLNSSFLSDVISGVEKIASESGYNLIISQSLETEKKEIANSETMFNNRVDGLLVSVAYDSKDVTHFLPFIEKKIPIIFFDRIFNHEECSSVSIDNFQAAYDATSHLVNEGCKKIIHVTGNLSRNVYTDRYHGFKKALVDHNIHLLPNHLIVNDLSIQAGIDAAKTIAEMPVLPDGVFVANDNCAASCMVELKRMGIKIPHDIQFVGFNNDPIASIVEPNLTTINYDGVGMGQMAAQTLINQLKKQTEAFTQTIILPHKLIIRKSSLRTINI